jgi:hypothetical protein
LAVPSVPSTGSRAVYFPAQPPVRPDPNLPAVLGVSPTTLPGDFGTPPQPSVVVDMPIPGPAGLPAIVIKPGIGVGPDFPGVTLLVWDQNGVAYIRTGMVSTTTWSGLGSPATVAHFALVDALS